MTVGLGKVKVGSETVSWLVESASWLIMGTCWALEGQNLLLRCVEWPLEGMKAVSLPLDVES